MENIKEVITLCLEVEDEEHETLEFVGIKGSSIEIGFNRNRREKF